MIKRPFGKTDTGRAITIIVVGGFLGLAALSQAHDNKLAVKKAALQAEQAAQKRTQKLAEEQKACVGLDTEWRETYCHRVDCDAIARDLVSNEEIIKGYRDKIRQNALDVSMGRRADYSAIAEDDRWSKSMIEAVNRDGVKLANEYLSHPSCTKFADTIRKLIPHLEAHSGE